MFTAAAQVAAVERRVTAYSEAGQGTDSSQPSFCVSEPCIPVRSGRPSLVQLAETGQHPVVSRVLPTASSSVRSASS